jgi:hypothetical protein
MISFLKFFILAAIVAACGLFFFTDKNGIPYADRLEAYLSSTSAGPAIQIEPTAEQLRARAAATK